MSNTMLQVSKFYVNGEWRSSPSARPVVNPYTAEPVAEVFQAGTDDISDAIAAAEAAFGETRRLTSYQRSEILFFIARGIEEKKEQLATILSGEIGKPITAARLEVERAAFTFAIAGEEAKRIGGEVIPLDLTAASGSRMGIIRRFPLGPVGAITPFNFPLNLVAHKVGPAIAAGNSVVLKPSSRAPAVSLALAEIVDKSGLPKGGFNVVPCLSKEGEQLYTDQRIKLISFTGSPAVGWYIKEKAGKKRVVLELGGNAGVIVDRDADLNHAYPRIVWGSYGIAGQSCIAVQRIFVHRSLFESFVPRFVELSRGVATGDPSDEKTVVGPMITEAAARKVEQWIAEAVAGGARVLCGGERKGALLRPTVIVDAKPEMEICASEVFAPVVTIEPFGDFREAVAMVNNSRYGLQAGVFTGSIANAMYAFENLEVGGVMVNDVPTYRLDHMPYGGVKDSGFGREGIRYAIEEMTEMKLLGLNVIG
jgi:acyl-CoA reductase-like NAD-dependent aldehyde dehydrogenase